MMRLQTPNETVREYVFIFSNELQDNLREYTRLINGIQELEDLIKDKKKQIVGIKKQIVGVKAKIEILQGVFNRSHREFNH